MRYLFTTAILISALYTTNINAQTRDTTANAASQAPADKKPVKIDRSKMNSGAANPLFQNKKKSWAVGIHAGVPFVEGDVPPQLTAGYGFFVRKAIGNSLSLRLNVTNGTTKGLDWHLASPSSYGSNNALNGFNDSSVNYYKSKAPVYYNYKMNFTTASLQLLYNINNINFMKEHPWFGLYVYGGVGTILYNTYVNQLDANGKMYDYSKIPIAKSYKDRKATLDALNSLLDNTYETQADMSVNDRMIFGRTVAPLLSFGIGMDFKITERISINVDASYGFTGDDLLDGQRWYAVGVPTSQPDAFGYGSVGITFRLGKTDNAYWFSNPLYLPYKEIIDDRRKIQEVSDKVDRGLADMKARLDTMGLNMDSLMSDKDSDGVSDFFDMEDGTPKGAIVDGAGRTIFYKDADGNLVFNDPNMQGAIDKMNGDENDPEGTTYKTDPDGTTYKTYPDGTVFQTNPDGTRTRKNPDGTVFKTSPDGKHYKIKPDGSQEEIAYDGTMPDAPDAGTVETGPDGTRTRKMKNGIVYKTTPDGKHYKVKPDGTQEEIAYDGTSPDNSKNAAVAGKKGKKTKFNPKDENNKTTVLKSDGKGGYLTPGSNSAIGYLPAIFFDTDKSFVKHDYYPEMFVAATSIKQNPNIKVRIIGHCDYRLSEAYNMHLGMQRAEAVAKILTEYFGIPADQFIIESRGKSEPLTNAKTIDALQLNRRVQFELIDGKKAAKKSTTSSTVLPEKSKTTTHTAHKEAANVSSEGQSAGAAARVQPASTEPAPVVVPPAVQPAVQVVAPPVAPDNSTTQPPVQQSAAPAVKDSAPAAIAPLTPAVAPSQPATTPKDTTLKTSSGINVVVPTDDPKPIFGSSSTPANTDTTQNADTKKDKKKHKKHKKSDDTGTEDVIQSGN